MNLKQVSRNGSEKKTEIMILNYEYINLEKNQIQKKNDKKNNDFTLSSETLRDPQIKKEINIQCGGEWNRSAGQCSDDLSDDSIKIGDKKWKNT